MKTYDKEIWKWLEIEDASAENPDKYVMISRSTQNSIFCMLDRNGKPGLIIRHKESGRVYRDMTPSRGFYAKIFPIHVDGSKYQELRISISGKEYSDIFITFADNLILCLQELPDDADFIKFASDHLSKWQKFMEIVNDEHLKPHQCRGLYGELSFLYHVLTPLIGIGAAVESWYGPDRKQQDFLLSNSVGVEIKTTTAKSPVSLKISSENQLDPAGFSHLYLHHNEIHEVQDSENTLAHLVDMISDECKQESYLLHMEFQRKLLELNYREKDREHYDKTGYHIRSETTYLVSGSFPNITGADLKDGIGDVSYSIQTSVLAPFAVDENKFHESLKEGYN